MAQDKFNRNWIIDNSVKICNEYANGDLTIRGLHYQLVGIGMTNSFKHYKRVVAAMAQARWDGVISFEQFSDNERAMIGKTESQATEPLEKAEDSKYYINYYLNNYYKNRWENQQYYPEVFIEKKALQNVFEKPCKEWNVALGACKGYPSLTFLNEAIGRFQEAVNNGKTPIILYFGDYDPSGEDIPRSISDNLAKLGLNVEVRRFSLLEEQVIKWNLPHAPTKLGDSRTANWSGLGQVELDAVKPEKLKTLCVDAIKSVFNEDKHEELLTKQASEKIIYKNELKDFVKNELK